jgi:hypothetical protein
MSAEKFSVSFDKPLATAVRKAAAEEGTTISSWLADAATAKAKRRHLRDALDAFGDLNGHLTDEDVDQLVREARTTSQVTGPRRQSAKPRARVRSKKVA